MPMLKMTFTLPLPPNRANSRYGTRGAHMAEHRAKKQYVSDAKQLILGQLVQQRQPVGLLKQGLFQQAWVTAEFWVRGRYDDDNIVNLLKWPLDVLVQAGVLKDDKRPWCALTGIPEQHVIRIARRKGESDGALLKRKLDAGYRVELTIEEARSDGTEQ